MGAAPMLLMSANAAASSFADSSAIQAEGKYKKTMSDINARNADIQAADALERGDEAAGVARRKAKQLEGRQRAAGAASGLDITSGSMAEILAETEKVGELDAQNIKSNAWREAWGFKSQANEYRNQGRLYESAAKYQSKQTLLTGGMKALSYGLSAYEKSDGGGKKKTGEERERSGRQYIMK